MTTRRRDLTTGRNRSCYMRTIGSGNNRRGVCATGGGRGGVVHQIHEIRGAHLLLRELLIGRELSGVELTSRLVELDTQVVIGLAALLQLHLNLLKLTHYRLGLHFVLAYLFYLLGQLVDVTLA